MPFSGRDGKNWTGKVLLQLNQHFQFKEILDIGVGAGVYSRLLRPYLPGTRWTGVEIWEPYVERFQLKEHYDQLVIEDVRVWPLPQAYDLAFLGDVLEHMAPREAISLVVRLLHQIQLLVISIPIVYTPQDEYEGNPYEAHVKDDWSHEEVLASFPNISACYRGKELGVYLLSSNQGVHEVVQLLIAGLESSSSSQTNETKAKNV